jgi:MFS superfamily sulfate permease-like transporter
MVGLRKTMKYLRIIDAWAEVRTQHLPNTSMEQYHYTCLLNTDFIGMVVTMMMMMMVVVVVAVAVAVAVAAAVVVVIFVRAKERISPSRFVAQTVIADGKVVRFRNGNSMNR